MLRIDCESRAPKAPSAAPESERYTVAKGDSLSKIAKKYYGDATQWRRIFEANRDRIEDPAWFRQAIASVATRLLNAEEADELARHFTLPGGREQRIALEVDIIGELLLANYTFTNRIEPDVRGTERELAALQTLWWAHEPFRVRDFTPYPEAMRFVSQDPGIKYTKMLSIQGIEAMSAHVDRSAAEAVEAVHSARIEIAPFVSAYRARQASDR